MNEEIKELAKSLLAGNFERQSPDAKSLSDPVADTQMVLTLDQLRAYELNPRITRNPFYDEIKESIRNRGLDAPPAVTRRPGEEHYIIRNGGNTRLSVLRELWSETKDEKYFRICCLYRPWQSEIVALTGHLAENELHGSLTYIERALGIQKAQEIYEQETQKKLSQSELARRLGKDGFPVSQSQISRMQDTVNYLLPAIPMALYGGLSNKIIIKLHGLWRSAFECWIGNARGKTAENDFMTLFQDVLSQFDCEPDEFDFSRMQDELIGQMAEKIGCSYELVSLEVQYDKGRRIALAMPPAELMALAAREDAQTPAQTQIPEDFIKPDLTDVINEAEKFASKFVLRPKPETAQTTPRATMPIQPRETVPERNTQHPSQIASPVESEEQYELSGNIIAERCGEETSEIWLIDAAMDSPESLRAHVNVLAAEIADEVELKDAIEPTGAGVGFQCRLQNDPLIAMLGAISRTPAVKGVLGLYLYERLGGLLIGDEDSDFEPMSDTAVIKLFRIIRLARRLYELETV
jgi:ParB family protein of integrating conjugative element (PFGI_1 class)